MAQDKYWQDPRLDDEGTYDYLVQELPMDRHEWQKTRYTCKCDSCYKESHLTHTDVTHFYCWDGWDSMSYTECWRCVLKYAIQSKIVRLKRKFKKTI